MAWVETWFPWWAEEEEDEEDWSIQDKKELEESPESRRRLILLQGYSSSGPLEVAVGPLRETSMSLERVIDSALKSRTTQSRR